MYVSLSLCLSSNQTHRDFLDVVRPSFSPPLRRAAGDGGGDRMASARLEVGRGAHA